LLDYQAKGEYLPKLALFADWPKSALPKDKAPLVIGILGNDPFGPGLDAALASQHVGGRSLRIQRFQSAADVLDGTCHLLFICMSEKEKVADILQALRGRPILTVADQNEEGANLLSLQTRQQLGVISLSLANQSQQAILRLF